MKERGCWDSYEKKTVTGENPANRITSLFTVRRL